MEMMEKRLANALARLADAADAYAADQDRAPHPSIALVQPVTVQEAEELNAAISHARDTLAIYDDARPGDRGN